MVHAPVPRGHVVHHLINVGDRPRCEDQIPIPLLIVYPCNHVFPRLRLNSELLVLDEVSAKAPLYKVGLRGMKFPFVPFFEFALSLDDMRQEIGLAQKSFTVCFLSRCRWRSIPLYPCPARISGNFEIRFLSFFFH